LWMAVERRQFFSHRIHIHVNEIQFSSILYYA
jgi:hypothetical protein